jgi:hypothetical protein
MAVPKTVKCHRINEKASEKIINKREWRWLLHNALLHSPADLKQTAIHYFATKFTLFGNACQLLILGRGRKMQLPRIPVIVHDRLPTAPECCRNVTSLLALITPRPGRLRKVWLLPQMP